ncbi:MAG TPA: hypothetical protein VJL81_14455 [Solirubrobacterales bacterium]|nr:hypothetical protein [Solirubrobacterales bacterium]
MSRQLKSADSEPPTDGSQIRITRSNEPVRASHTPTEVEASLEEMLTPPEFARSVPAGRKRSGEQEWRVRHERERPSPSTVWRGAGGVSIAIAATAIIAVLTIHDGSSPQISLPLAIGIAGLVVAAVCGVAHYDVNRGRKVRRLEVREEPGSGGDGED